MKEKLINKETVLGTMISEFAVPNIIRIMKAGGFEFVIIDCEHGPFDLSQLGQMTAVANGIEMPVLVRVPGIERGFITKVLDMGADGLLVPMVNTAKEAERLVECAKYSPLGKRGISTTRAHTGYQPPRLEEYMKAANGRTILLTQIETKAAVENAEEIAAVAGVDALILGPSDLSSDLGCPGSLTDERLLESAKRVATAAAKHGKASGTVASNVGYLHKCRDMGMSLFSMSSELGMLLSGAKGCVERFNTDK